MKILEINKYNFPKGGADKHFLDVINLLGSKGNEVAVFSMESSKNNPSRWNKYFVSEVGYTKEYSIWQKVKGIGRMFYSFEAKRKINKLLDDFNPDIVHIHNIYHQISPVILFEIKKRGIPIIMTVHDYKLVSPNYNLCHNGKDYERGKNGKHWQCLLDKCIKNSYLKSFIAVAEAYWHDMLGTFSKNVDLFIVPSFFAKDKLVEWGMNEDKIFLLPHFSSFPSLNNFTKKEKRYAIYFGRISKEKGIGELIEIFKELKNIDLYLAGDIENEFKIEENDKIKYLGFLKKNELEKYIQGADFVVSGSKLPETFGLVALEAIMQGKPFLGLRTGAYGEIIENNINGYLGKDGDDLKYLLNRIDKGEVVFNQEKIKREAQKRYNPDEYYVNLKRLAKLLGA